MPGVSGMNMTLNRGPQWPDMAALDWLAIVLRERLSRHLSLSPDRAGFIRMSVPGSDRRVRIRSDFDLFARGGSDLSCGAWSPDAEKWRGSMPSPLPAPGWQDRHGPLIESDALGYTIHYDLLGLTYWMLSRREEVGRTDLDSHGRFPATSSHAYKHGYLKRPIVDEWLAILAQVADRLWPNLERVSSNFSMRVSHDVDWASRYGFCSAGQLLRHAAGDALKRRDPRSLMAPLIWRGSRTALHRADPFNTFDWIMDCSERHGLTSAFYFICGRTDPSKDAWYEPEHPAIRALMRRIHERGHEIGLHPSYNAYRNPEVVIDEARRLKRVCAEEGIEQAEWGGRMHFLRWETPTTWYGWEGAGMTYDSSLSYVDQAGFRCGTCFSYPAFDAVSNRTLRLRVIPLIAMEQSVIGSTGPDMDTGASALEEFVRLKNACRAVGGCFTLLWHNSQFDSADKRSLYKNLLS